MKIASMTIVSSRVATRPTPARPAFNFKQQRPRRDDDGSGPDRALPETAIASRGFRRSTARDDEDHQEDPREIRSGYGLHLCRLVYVRASSCA